MQRFHQLSIQTSYLGYRTMDILHVACALEIGATQFLTFDQRQQSLAIQASLTSSPP